MVNVQMADILAKRDRAEKHLQALDSAINAFFESQPYAIAVEPDRELGRHVVRLMDPQPIPQREWGVLIGDCVHDLRCTLDYIAWQLAGADMTDRGTLFLIAASPKQFRKRRMKRLGRLPDSAVALIRCLQPYNTWNPFGRNLALIERLDVADKHKLLTVVVASQGAASFEVYPSSVPKLFPARYEHRAIIAEIDAPLEEHVEVKYEPIFLPAFSPGLGAGQRRFVIPSLNNALRDFDKIIGMFSDLSF